jgi:hypothetical protein
MVTLKATCWVLGILCMVILKTTGWVLKELFTAKDLANQKVLPVGLICPVMVRNP